MRLFIAIELNDDMRGGLVSLQSAMRKGGARGNFTKPENLHLTLAFIGEYADPEGVLNAMDAVPFTPFRIRLEGFGSFGDLYWRGIADSGELSGYVKRLRRALAEAGIPFDRKRFSPHITLLRRASWEDGRGLSGLVMASGEMEVRAVSLMRSDRGKNGMIYTQTGQVFADAE